MADDANLIGDFVADFSGEHADRREGKWRVIAQYVTAVVRRPYWLLRLTHLLAGQLWRARKSLWPARGRVSQISFFIQDFIDATDLDAERIEACSFMVMTADGPLSMCQHNAQRDEYILKPPSFRRRDGSLVRYEPLAKGVLARERV